MSLAFLLLWLDRHFGTHFFDVADGRPAAALAAPVLDVRSSLGLCVVLPAMGIVSDALPTFCRRPLVGYTAWRWPRWRRCARLRRVDPPHVRDRNPADGAAFFGAASMVIAIPSAVAVFAWIATIWLGRPVFTAPLLFFAGFVVLFVIGGVSGVMTAAVPLDWQLTDTYFVVAHLHYVLLGINVFPVIGGIYYWFPKFTGRMMDETSRHVELLGHVHRLQRRVLPDAHRRPARHAAPHLHLSIPDGVGSVNMITTIGAFVFAIGVLIFLMNVVISLRRGARAGANPWDAATLEWSTSSPPPAYNFAVMPTVASRHPLWEDRLGEGRERSNFTEGLLLDKGAKRSARPPSMPSPWPSSKCRMTPTRRFFSACSFPCCLSACCCIGGCLQPRPL